MDEGFWSVSLDALEQGGEAPGNEGEKARGRERRQNLLSVEVAVPGADILGLEVLQLRVNRKPVAARRHCVVFFAPAALEPIPFAVRARARGERSFFASRRWRCNRPCASCAFSLGPREWIHSAPRSVLSGRKSVPGWVRGESFPNPEISFRLSEVTELSRRRARGVSRARAKEEVSCSCRRGGRDHGPSSLGVPRIALGVRSRRL